MRQIPELEQIMDLGEGKPVTLEYLKDISTSVGGNIFSLTGLSSTQALTSSPYRMITPTPRHTTSPLAFAKP